MKDKKMHGVRLRSRGLLACAALAAALLGLAACESDDPNGVGMDLVDVEIDALLQTADIYDLPDYRNIPVRDTAVPFHEQQVLYLGEQNGNESSIVVQFDFGAFVESALAAGLTMEELEAPNLRTGDLRLFILSAYAVPDTSLPTDLEKYPWYSRYELREAAEEIDASLYPGGPVPAVSGVINENSGDLQEDGTMAIMEVDSVSVANWLAEGAVRTFVISEGFGSGVGMTGYAANEMAYGGSTLDPTAAVDYVGPVINVQVVSRDSVITIPSLNDFSTFHEIADVPTDITDSFVLRTCLRNYPALYFDLSQIPKDVFINRAEIRMENDPENSWGQAESIVISEFDVELFGAAGDSLDLDELEGALYPVTGQISFYPTEQTEYVFNVTTSIQRYVNDAYEGTRGFLLTPGEDFLSDYDASALDPDFYFNQFGFFGTAADDTLRPRLLVTYAASEEVQGGGK